jgi:hypothetical protein
LSPNFPLCRVSTLRKCVLPRLDWSGPAVGLILTRRFFPAGVRHPCDKPAHTPGPYPRLMEAATRAAPRKSAGFHVCRTTSESGGAESAPKRPILAEEPAQPGFFDRI